MTTFFYGEIGYQAEEQNSDISAIEAKAIEHSIAQGCTAINIWNDDDEVISVVIEGQVFDKRNTQEILSERSERCMEHSFEAQAIQQGKKHDDGSGETAVWTDGLLVGACDSRQDNLTPIKLVAGKKYRASVKVEEISD